MKISVIVPAHNEETHIVVNTYKIIHTLKELNYDYEIIIVDDASNDDTYLLAAKGIDHKKVIILRKIYVQGKGAAIKTGWKFATGDYIAIMDADLQILPKEIKTFFKIMKFYDADVVIGNKKHIYSNIEYPLLRKIVSAGYHILIKILFDLSLRDTQCGFKLFKKQALDLVMDKILVKQFAFDLEILVALKDNNVRVADAPVYVTKSLGTGSVNIKTILETFKDTLAIWYRRQKGYYKNAPRN